VSLLLLLLLLCVMTERSWRENARINLSSLTVPRTALLPAPAALPFQLSYVMSRRKNYISPATAPSFRSRRTLSGAKWWKSDTLWRRTWMKTGIELGIQRVRACTR